MYNKEDILMIVCKHLVEFTESEQEINAETDIAEQLSLDSVKILDLLMEIEDEFDISVPLNMMADVQTVNDLVGVIYNLEAEK